MTPARIETAGDLRAHLANGTKPLGALVYWNGLANVRIPRGVFRAEFERLGLGTAIGRDPKAEACLSMAASVASSSRKGAAKVKLKEKGTHAVYAVMMRRDITLPDHDLRLRLIEEARIAIDRGQPSPTPTVITADDVAPDDDRDAVIDAVIAEYTDLLANARTEEVSEALMEAMVLLGGLTLRPGVYFVPTANLGRLHDLRVFIEAYTSIAISAWDISTTDVNAAQTVRDARATFLDKIHELAEECRTYVEAKGDDELTAKSINTRIRRFQDLDGQVELYADILGDQAKQLRTTLEAARAAFQKSVLG
jgi:hypothetical protein